MKIVKDLMLKLLNWYSFTVLTAVWISVSMVWDKPHILTPLIFTIIVLFLLIADSLIKIKIDFPLLSNKYILYSLIFFVSGLLISLSVSQFIFFFLLIIGGLLYVQRYLTEQLYLLNILILSLFTGCTFWLSGMAVKPNMISFLPGSIFPSIIIFIFTSIYLILSEARKIENGKSKMEIPIVKKFSASNAVMVSIGLLFLMILLSYWPILNNWYSDIYKIIFVYLVELPLLGFLIIVWGNPVQTMLSITKIILKVDIILGFTAFYFA